MKIILVILMAIAIVSCEENVSKDEYIRLYDQYENEYQNVISLRTKCKQLETEIDDLQNRQVDLKKDVNRLSNKINDAIKSAENCEEYFDELEDEEVVYDSFLAVDLIMEVKNSVDACW